MTNISSVITILLLSATIGTAQAQGFFGLFGQAPRATETRASPADCEQLAAMPNAPISPEACKSMMGMAATYDAGATDPNAQRSGDDRLSCAQIFAEVQGMDNVGVSDANTANAETMVKEATATAKQGAADITAFMAEAQLMGLGAGLLSAYTPNFVPNPMLILFQARLAALTARSVANQKQLSARLDQTLPAISGDLSRTMQSNPRFARLMQLAIAKNCEPPRVDAR